MIMIADRIKSLRESRHLSQSELAKHLGLSRAGMNAWEMGISGLTDEDKEVVLRLIEYLRRKNSGLELQKKQKGAAPEGTAPSLHNRTSDSPPDAFRPFRVKFSAYPLKNQDFPDNSLDNSLSTKPCTFTDNG